MTPLSKQETRVFGYLVQDLSMKEIAAIMKLCPTTVDTYAKSVYIKKNVRTRIGLIIQFYSETKDKS